MIRSWLYCPGNSPGKMLNAGIYGADGIVLDLEDSVSPEDKDQARILVSEALENHSFGIPCTVRINGCDTSWWIDDIGAVVAAGASILRVPKVEEVRSLTALVHELESAEAAAGRTAGCVSLQLILESPLGVENAFSLAAAAAGRVSLLCFGAEDYSTAVGIERRGPAYVLDYPRSRVAAAAASIAVPCCDTVWPDYRDPEGLARESRRARELGFTSKSVIHPDQVGPVNDAFSITPEEIHWAEQVLARSGGSIAATGMDGAMIDAPVVKRARRILERRDGRNA